jgi:hypothetical protein
MIPIPLIPDWIQTFVLAGLLLLGIAVPLRVLWERTAGARERRERLRGLAERLEERFGAVLADRTALGDRLRFEQAGGRVALRLDGEDRMELRLEDALAPSAPLRMRSGRAGWPWTWIGGRLLGRVRTGDALVDDAWRIWTTPGFAAYLQELAMEPVPGNGAAAFAASLIDLKSLPGLKRLDLRFSPASGVSLRLRLRGRDLLYRSDLLEALLHHLRRIHHELALR